ncbi:Esc1p SCDLUD_002223 [Saccharomycodes ludwigii]|uniref:Esc1p n=1 Tax=Saccharomycodes ludwigii TaxID=36035 RepID=UPI001E85BBDA|nr:hypothetical protein SCDLUD_002223 [Saccharomycodes ludwigii]KAH3902402.1 hypothetical protein SCDLUD_002223 [Saccharomycodes ludwigii]
MKQENGKKNNKKNEKNNNDGSHLTLSVEGKNFKRYNSPFESNKNGAADILLKNVKLIPDFKIGKKTTSFKANSKSNIPESQLGRLGDEVCSRNGILTSKDSSTALNWVTSVILRGKKILQNIQEENEINRAEIQDIKDSRRLESVNVENILTKSAKDYYCFNENQGQRDNDDNLVKEGGAAQLLENASENTSENNLENNSIDDLFERSSHATPISNTFYHGYHNKGLGNDEEMLDNRAIGTDTNQELKEKEKEKDESLVILSSTEEEEENENENEDENENENENENEDETEKENKQFQIQTCRDNNENSENSVSGSSYSYSSEESSGFVSDNFSMKVDQKQKNPRRHSVISSEHEQLDSYHKFDEQKDLTHEQDYKHTFEDSKDKFMDWKHREQSSINHNKDESYETTFKIAHAALNEYNAFELNSFSKEPSDDGEYNSDESPQPVDNTVERSQFNIHGERGQADYERLQLEEKEFGSDESVQNIDSGSFSNEISEGKYDYNKEDTAENDEECKSESRTPPFNYSSKSPSHMFQQQQSGLRPERDESEASMVSDRETTLDSEEKITLSDENIINNRQIGENKINNESNQSSSTFNEVYEIADNSSESNEPSIHENINTDNNALNEIIHKGPEFKKMLESDIGSHYEDEKNSYTESSAGSESEENEERKQHLSNELSHFPEDNTCSTNNEDDNNENIDDRDSGEEPSVSHTPEDIISNKENFEKGNLYSKAERLASNVLLNMKLPIFRNFQDFVNHQSQVGDQDQVKNFEEIEYGNETQEAKKKDMQQNQELIEEKHSLEPEYHTAYQEQQTQPGKESGYDGPRNRECHEHTLKEKGHNNEDEGNENENYSKPEQYEQLMTHPTNGKSKNHSNSSYVEQNMTFTEHKENVVVGDDIFRNLAFKEGTDNAEQKVSDLNDIASHNKRHFNSIELSDSSDEEFLHTAQISFDKTTEGIGPNQENQPIDESLSGDTSIVVNRNPTNNTSKACINENFVENNKINDKIMYSSKPASYGEDSADISKIKDNTEYFSFIQNKPKFNLVYGSEYSSVSDEGEQKKDINAQDSNSNLDKYVSPFQANPFTFKTEIKLDPDYVSPFLTDPFNNAKLMSGPEKRLMAVLDKIHKEKRVKPQNEKQKSGACLNNNNNNNDIDAIYSNNSKPILTNSLTLTNKKEESIQNPNNHFVEPNLKESLKASGTKNTTARNIIGVNKEITLFGNSSKAPMDHDTEIGEGDAFDLSANSEPEHILMAKDTKKRDSSHIISGNNNSDNSLSNASIVNLDEKNCECESHHVTIPGTEKILVKDEIVNPVEKVPVTLVYGNDDKKDEPEDKSLRELQSKDTSRDLALCSADESYQAGNKIEQPIENRILNNYDAREISAIPESEKKNEGNCAFQIQDQQLSSNTDNTFNPHNKDFAAQTQKKGVFPNNMDIEKSNVEKITLKSQQTTNDNDVDPYLNNEAREKALFTSKLSNIADERTKVSPGKNKNLLSEDVKAFCLKSDLPAITKSLSTVVNLTDSDIEMEDISNAPTPVLKDDSLELPKVALQNINFGGNFTVNSGLESSVSLDKYTTPLESLNGNEVYGKNWRNDNRSSVDLDPKLFVDSNKMEVNELPVKGAFETNDNELRPIIEADNGGSVLPENGHLGKHDLAIDNENAINSFEKIQLQDSFRNPAISRKDEHKRESMKNTTLPLNEGRKDSEEYQSMNVYKQEFNEVAKKSSSPNKKLSLLKNIISSPVKFAKEKLNNLRALGSTANEFVNLLDSGDGTSREDTPIPFTGTVHNKGDHPTPNVKMDFTEKNERNWTSDLSSSEEEIHLNRIAKELKGKNKPPNVRKNNFSDYNIADNKYSSTKHINKTNELDAGMYAEINKEGAKNVNKNNAAIAFGKTSNEYIKFDGTNSDVSDSLDQDISFHSTQCEPNKEELNNENKEEGIVQVPNFYELPFLSEHSVLSSIVDESKKDLVINGFDGDLVNSQNQVTKNMPMSIYNEIKNAFNSDSLKEGQQLANERALELEENKEGTRETEEYLEGHKTEIKNPEEHIDQNEERNTNVVDINESERHLENTEELYIVENTPVENENSLGETEKQLEDKQDISGIEEHIDQNEERNTKVVDINESEKHLENTEEPYIVENTPVENENSLGETEKQLEDEQDISGIEEHIDQNEEPNTNVVDINESEKHLENTEELYIVENTPVENENSLGETEKQLEDEQDISGIEKDFKNQSNSKRIKFDTNTFKRKLSKSPNEPVATKKIDDEHKGIKIPVTDENEAVCVKPETISVKVTDLKEADNYNGRDIGVPKTEKRMKVSRGGKKKRRGKMNSNKINGDNDRNIANSVANINPNKTSNPTKKTKKVGLSRKRKNPKNTDAPIAKRLRKSTLSKKNKKK